MPAARLLQATCSRRNRHRGSVHYITIGDSRLCTMGCEMRSPLYLIGDAASLRGLCTGTNGRSNGKHREGSSLGDDVRGRPDDV